MTDLRTLIEQLDPARQALLERRLRKLEPVRPRLIAYATMRTDATDPAALREWLAGRLPAHMVPDAVMILEAMPRLPNGKVDHRGLSRLRPEEQEKSARSERPHDKVERILTDIWGDLLGIDDVSVEDDFFELGGDSLLSIRMVSMARQAGVHIRPTDLADNSTIARLAKTVKADQVDGATSDVTEAPVLPIQAWHLTRGLSAPAHWNQSWACRLAAGLGRGEVQAALDAVAAHHPGLSARFREEAEGWRQYLPETPKIPLMVLGPDQPLDAVAEAAAQRFRLDCPLILAGLSEATSDAPTELVIIANHLLTDMVSWSVIAEDLNRALDAAHRGQRIELPPAVSSLAWAVEVERYARSDAAMLDVAPWLELDRTTGRARCDTEATSGRISRTLDPTVTTSLMGSANRAFNTQTLDLLLWSLAETLANGEKATALRIDIETHGRLPRFSETPLNRTVGWLTSYFPVVVSLEASQPEARARAIKEDLHRFQSRGESFGAVRYHGPETLRRRLEAAQSTDVLLNYLGSSRPLQSTSFTTLDPPRCHLRSPDNLRPHDLEFNVEEADGQMRLELTYSDSRLDRPGAQALLDRFAERIEAIVTFCVQCQETRFTPSDFEESGLTQDELDAFLDEI